MKNDKLKSILLRILLVVITFPILGLAIWTSNNKNYVTFAIIMFIAITSTLEMVNMLNKKNFNLSKTIAILIGISTPILTYININFYENTFLYVLIEVVILIIIFSFEVFSFKEKDWATSIFKLCGYAFIFIYISIFLSCLILMQKTISPVFTYTFFLLLIFSNDTFAYIFGMLLGKWTPKPFPVSPKKSVAGFVGGTVGCITTAIITYFIYSDIYANNIFFAVLTGIVISTAGNIGDLVESTFKRATDMKDSGKIMLGRGGMLDSIDSILFSAPIFLISVKIFELLK